MALDASDAKRILVTGGAGYIGSILVRLLLERGYKVRVLDVLLFGGESLLELFNNPDFEFIRGDVRDKQTLEKALQDVDYVVHLAAIVGDPACARQPELATQVNLEATKNLYNLAEQYGVRRFVFASTCSNYGKMEDPDAYVDENSPLRPVSHYARTKVEAELFLLNQPRTNVCKPTVLRFATVYGISPRMRFDLTVNEFTKELVLGRELIVYGEQFWRPYCHVVDLARSVVLALETKQEKVAFEVFNVGDTSENYRKQMIVDEIVKQIPNAKIKYVKKDEDPRDYRVSFEKIKRVLGFKITKRVPDGIRQIKQVLESGIITDPDSPKYKNIPE